MLIVPAILTDDLNQALAMLTWARENELERVQLDVMDGSLTEQSTIHPNDLAGFEWGEKLKVDLHIMTEEPAEIIRDIEEDGLMDFLPVNNYLAQIERLTSLEHLFDEVKRVSWKPGLSLDVHTPIDELSEIIFEKNNFAPRLRAIQLMAVEIGRQNQVFQPEAWQKLNELNELLREENVEFDQLEIMLDGGIKTEEVTMAKENDLAIINVGSAIWQGGPDQWEKNWEAIQTADI